LSMGFFRRMLGLEENTGEESRARQGTEAGESGSAPADKKEEKPLFNPWEEIKDYRYQFFFGRMVNRKSPSDSAAEAYRKYIEEITREREERYQLKQAEKRRIKEEKRQRKGPG
jgi:hypothetical protein